MANAQVVIPGALTQLATAVALDATLTTAQTVYTVPAGMRAVPLFFIFRDAGTTSTPINAACTVSVGNTASATAYLSASGVLQSMLTTTGAIVTPAYGSSVGTAKALQPSLSNFTVTFGGTQTSNGTVKCDVIGYLTAF